MTGTCGICGRLLSVTPQEKLCDKLKVCRTCCDSGLLQFARRIKERELGYEKVERKFGSGQKSS